MQSFRTTLTAFLWSAMLVVPSLTGLAQTTNQVLSLDGSGDYVSVPSAPELQNPTEITVEAWVYPGGGGGNPQYFISKSDGVSGNSSRAYEMVWYSTGGNTGPGNRIEVSFFLGSNTWAAVGAPAPSGQWIHVAATYQSTNGLQQLFTNGVLAVSKTTGGGTTGSSVAGLTIRQTSQPIYFGKLGNPLNDYALGDMDEVRIWSKARSQAEIAGTMSCRSTGVESNLVAYWMFDGGTANDLTGHGHDGTLYGGAAIVPMVGGDVVHQGVCGVPCAPRPWGMVAWWPGDGNAMDIIGGNNGTLVNGVSYAPGVLGDAFSFDGGAKTGIKVPDYPALKLTNSLTIEAWVKIGGLTNTIDGMILFRGDDRGGLDPYALAISGGTTSAVFHIAASLTSEAGVAAPVPMGRFFHLAATLDGTSGKMSLYVDGALARTNTTAVRPFGDLDPSANPAVGIGNIGGLPLSIYASPFRGLIDDLRVYSRALSASEIKAIADAGTQGLCPAVTPRTAMASAVLVNDFVVGANITDGGYGYTNTPTVRIIGGGGSGAQGVAVVSNGVVIAVNMLNAGYGYTNTPAIVIAPPFIEQPTMGIAAMSLLSFTNLAVGTNYQLQRFFAATWADIGEPFTAAGSIFTQRVSGTASANGYRLAITPVPSQAYATAQVVNGFVVGATVTSGGSGYTTNPAVNISGDSGSNATAIATVSEGVVTGITITSAGLGYANTAIITIAPPPTMALSPDVTQVMKLDLGRLSPYDNYQLEFAPVAGGTWSNFDIPFTPTSTTNTQYINVTGELGFFRVRYAP